MSDTEHEWGWGVPQPCPREPTVWGKMDSQMIVTGGQGKPWGATEQWHLHQTSAVQEGFLEEWH